MARARVTSLHAAMVEPSTIRPDIVVLDSVDQDPEFKEIADPKEDLWLSTVDGQVISLLVNMPYALRVYNFIALLVSIAILLILVQVPGFT